MLAQLLSCLTKKTGCFFLSLLFLIDLNAQEPFYIQYSNQDGLPSNEVYDIEVMPDGVIWFTTDRGVCTYDGDVFTTYTTADGLADNTNFEIHRDSKNRLWFNGFNGKVTIYEHGKFFPYAYNDSLESIYAHTSGISKWLSGFWEGKDDSLFFSIAALQHQELYCLSYNDPPFKLSRKSFGSPGTHKALNDELGIQWLDSNITARNFLFTSALGNEKLGFYGNFLFQFSDKDQKTEKVVLSDRIDNISVDDHSNLWACTFNGLYFFEKGQLTQRPIKYFNEQVFTYIVQDVEGGYWASTTESGVYYIPSFKIQTLDLNNQISDNEHFVSVGNLDDRIFFGSNKGRAISIDKSRSLTEILNTESAIHPIDYIEKVPGKNALALNYGYVIEPDHDQLELMNLKFHDIAVLHKFSAILRNNQCIIPSKIGFAVKNYDWDKEKAGPNLITVKLSAGLRKIIQGDDEIIWIGTLDGLYQIKNYDYSNPVEVFTGKGKRFGRIKDMHRDARNHLWIATVGQGLFYYNSNHTINISTTEGLNSNLVNDICLQNDSVLWVGTNKGLSSLTYAVVNDSLVIKDVLNLTIKDGLSSNYVNGVDYWNGNVWVATNKGICYFDPSGINRQHEYPHIQLDDLQVGDTKHSDLNDITLAHDANDLTLTYSAVSFNKDANKPFYRYRLLRSRDTSDWFYTNEKTARYNNLQAGDYTFQVSVRNKEDKWKPEPASLSFKIKPHFTETSWFKVLLVFTLFTFMMLLLYWQNRRIQSRQKAEQKEREVQLQARTAELKALRNQMNPHFVFNALNSIQNYVFKHDAEGANHYLSMFSKLMRSSLKNSRLDFITLKEEIAFLKDYLTLEAMRFSNRFDFQIECEEDIPKERIMMPPLLLQPILENAVKHAFKNIRYKGELLLRISMNEDRCLDILVTDNGPGISVIPSDNMRTVKHDSAGLKIVKERIELLNETEYEQKASIEVINLSELDKTKKGLQVHLILPIKGI